MSSASHMPLRLKLHHPRRFNLHQPQFLPDNLPDALLHEGWEFHSLHPNSRALPPAPFTHAPAMGANNAGIILSGAQ